MRLTQRVEEQTPASRDRYLDLLRVASILVVVLNAPSWRRAREEGEDAMVLDPDTAITPIWFLAAYLVVTALTPLTLRLHEWADDRLAHRPWRQLGLGLAGAGALLVMIGPGPYPLTMVPIAGTDLPNNLSPPSAALAALGGCQLSFALLARDRVTGWLRDRRVWTAVALPGGRLMTIYLWHQTAMLVVANATILTGLWPLSRCVRSDRPRRSADPRRSRAGRRRGRPRQDRRRGQPAPMTMTS